MSRDWISNPILCDGHVACSAIVPSEPLLPLRAQIAFRASLLFNAWQADACDGRQMSLDDFDRMDDFAARFSDASLDEREMRGLVADFGNFLPKFVTNGPVNVPKRALIWAQQDKRI